VVRDSKIVKCPLCGAAEASPFLASRRAGAADKAFCVTTNTFGDFRDILKCRDCGFVFQHVAPSELEQAYASVVDERYLAEERGRRKTATRILEAIEAFAESGCICDVGCFTGLLLTVAQDRGWTAFGIEPSHWAADIARERHGLNVAERALETAGVPEGLFDVVTLIDVIEHLREPGQALTRVRQLLKSDGYIYVSTPDVSSIAARILGRRWWGYRLEHTGYFSRDTMQIALEQAGFRVLEAWRRGRDFSVQYWLSKLIDLSSSSGRRVTTMLSKLGIDRQLLYLNFGDQIDILGRKRT
jgi:SAM-dependent methyltransferase